MTERKVFSFHEWATNQGELEAQGRFAKVTEAKVVRAGAAYPRQREGSPFACDPVPTEPPLGHSIDALSPVSEPHEVSRSAAPTELADGLATQDLGSSGSSFATEDRSLEEQRRA